MAARAAQVCWGRTPARKGKGHIALYLDHNYKGHIGPQSQGSWKTTQHQTTRDLDHNYKGHIALYLDHNGKHRNQHICHLWIQGAGVRTMGSTGISMSIIRGYK
eukprot:scaffold39800_cov19-Tisochrysis_lutea.AAC.1